MGAPIITGANIFRAKKILTPAEIFGLDTTRVLIVPKGGAQAFALIAALGKFTAGTEPYSFFGPAAGLEYETTSGNLITGFDIVGDPTGNPPSNIFNGSGFISTGSFIPFPANQGIYLYGTTPGFNSGSVTAAAVTPGNAGLLYALGDMGTINAGDNTAIYTVTGAGAGGAVTTVTVSGGQGYTTGLGFGTSPTTGAGDGLLELDITAIRNIGNGTLEIDLLYQPI